MRKFLFICITFLSLLIVIVLFSPSIASTQLGKKIIESAISQRINGDVEIGSWELSWFGPQVIRNGEIKNNKIKLSFTEINAKLPFWSFLKLTAFNEKVLQDLDGSARLKNGEIVLHSKNEPDVFLQNIDLIIYGNEGEDVHFNLKSDSQVDQTIGSILIDGRVANFTNFFNTSMPSIIKVIAVNFPSKSIDIFLKSLKKKGKFFKFLKQNPNFFSSLFGVNVNANILIDNKQNENRLLAEILSTNLKADLDATIEDKNLYLNKNLNFVFYQINDLSNKLIKNMNPLFITSINSLNPVTLEIFKEGFQLPFDVNLNNLNISKAVLDVGKLKCQNGKLLEAITKAAKLKNKNNELIVWCTPLTFQIRNKIFATERLDALIEDSIHVATLGDANLATHKLDMILAIPKDALEKIFNLKNIPDDFILQIPIKGSFEKPKIKIKQALAKLSMLLASQKAKEVSTLLKILKKLDQKEFPPPNQPYPWEIHP